VQVRHAVSYLHQLQCLAVLSVSNVQVGDVRAGFGDVLEGGCAHLEPRRHAQVCDQLEARVPQQRNKLGVVVEPAQPLVCRGKAARHKEHYTEMRFQARDALMQKQAVKRKYKPPCMTITVSTYTPATCCCPCSSDHAIAQASAQYVTV
jgi:hypothetical protein